MKRSEMENILSIHIKAMDWENEDCDYYARKLLNIIESNGMLPPTITVLKDSYNRAEGRMGFDSNEWEPEDDQE